MHPIDNSTLSQSPDRSLRGLSRRMDCPNSTRMTRHVGKQSPEGSSEDFCHLQEEKKLIKSETANVFVTRNRFSSSFAEQTMKANSMCRKSHGD